jgi:hypothetical protein
MRQISQNISPLIMHPFINQPQVEVCLDSSQTRVESCFKYFGTAVNGFWRADQAVSITFRSRFDHMRIENP